MKRLYTLTILLSGALWFLHTAAYAQQSTFFESFDSTPLGSLPAGWTAWQNGGGGGSAVWTVMSDGPWSTDQYAMSIEEPGREGMTDEDWMITPSITPQAGDFLMFKTRRGYDDTTDKYSILISTTTASAPAAFTQVLAEYDMNTMPSLTNKFQIDLADYAGIPIYIAFVHTADVGPDVYSGFWLVNDVEVRPIQQAFVTDAFFRQATSPPQPPVMVSDPLIFTGTVEFVVKGDYGTANISSVTLTAEGTTDMSMVKEVIVYAAPWGLVSDDEILDGTIPVFGSVQNPGTVFEVTGSADLSLNTQPFFFIRYVLSEDYVVTAPYPQIDVAIMKYVANDEERVPKTGSFFGAIDVVPTEVYNDNFAAASELSPTPARYWSSTMPATYEPQYDKIAYCHNVGNKAVHSVWWYFIPPTDGVITVDLSDSHCNTLLSIIDENFNQLACNDDINDANTRSRISALPVRKGQKIYVRASDLGDVGPNQYLIAGVIALDFSFSLVTGTTPEFDPGMLTVYPNPTSGEVTVAIETQQPGAVSIEITDIMGRTLQTHTTYFSKTGRNEVPLSMTGYQAGTYLIKVSQNNKTAFKKLSLTR